MGGLCQSAIALHPMTTSLHILFQAKDHSSLRVGRLHGLESMRRVISIRHGPLPVDPHDRTARRHQPHIAVPAFDAKFPWGQGVGRAKRPAVAPYSSTACACL